MKIVYRDPNTEQKEVSHLLSFLDLTKYDVNGWIRSHPPCPDFLLDYNDKKVGLEITSLMNETDGDFSLAQIRAAQNKCIRKARTRAEENNVPPLEVKAGFTSPSRPIDVDSASTELYNYVISKIDDIPKNKALDCKNMGLEYFNWIRIRSHILFNKVWLQLHDWSRLDVCFVNINPYELLQKRIDDKQKKITGYLSCCEKCWLLIGVDEWTSPEAIKFTNNDSHVFYGDFDKLFFLQNIRGSLIEFNILKST